MDINKILQQIDMLYEKNQGEAAEQLMVEAIQEAAEKQDDEVVLQLLNELLGYYRETSQVENSYAIAQQSLKVAEKMGIVNTIPYATTLLNIANAYRAGGRLEESLEYYEQVRTIYNKLLSADSLLVASLENNKSLLFQEMGDFQRAKESLLHALEIVNAKGAEFEIAVTHANLANTYMQLGAWQEAYETATKAIAEFEKMKLYDFHYGAALSALGNYYFVKREFVRAKETFEKARDIMEEKLGRNEYFSRLQENVAECDREISTLETTSSLDAEKVNTLRGLDLCREYYEAYGKAMIEEKFPEYVSKIAVGLVGEGSDCFGYDDEISRDHDWGPGFCMWITEDTYREIGEALQMAYEQLPGAYKGYKGNFSKRGEARRGVAVIPKFYQYFIDSDTLAAAVNGAVFRDDEGVFSAKREWLLKGYPEPVMYRKLAESAACFSQTGQYNLPRCRKRGDEFTAGIMLVDCVREAMKLKHYLAGKYPPHDKWLYRSLQELPGGKEMAELLEEVIGAVDGKSGKGKQSLRGTEDVIEQIATLLVKELYAKHYISDVNNYLDFHTEELLCKGRMSELDNMQLIDKIVRLEFDAFDKVRNVGGRASCQNDWPTFYVMRKSQYLTWNRTMLLQYYYDFQREYGLGHNLIEEKYGRMMESTAPLEYQEMKQYFPTISPQKEAIINQIVELQVGWMEVFAEEYPGLAANARSIHAKEDHLYNTSYETYLRGEISTYSDKMLELYGKYIVAYATNDKNPAYEIMGNSAKMYGYESLEAAEKDR